MPGPGGRTDGRPVAAAEEEEERRRWRGPAFSGFGAQSQTDGGAVTCSRCKPTDSRPRVVAAARAHACGEEEGASTTPEVLRCYRPQLTTARLAKPEGAKTTIPPTNPFPLGVKSRRYAAKVPDWGYLLLSIAKRATTQTPGLKRDGRCDCEGER